MSGLARSLNVYPYSHNISYNISLNVSTAMDTMREGAPKDKAPSHLVNPLDALGSKRIGSTTDPAKSGLTFVGGRGGHDARECCVVNP